MPNKAIQNAKRLRGGALGQSSRFYNIYGQQVGASNPDGFKGGQGWTAPKPQIGSMLSLGIMKQNKNAGGNNVCQPGPGPKNTCVPKSGSNNLTVGNSSDVIFGFSTGSLGGDFTPQTIGGQVVVNVNYSVAALTFVVQTNVAQVQTLFSSISFINCEDNTVRTYNTAAATFTGSNTWSWDVAASGFSATNELAYWYTLNPNKNTSLGKTVKVVIDDNTLATGNGTGDYCCTNNDCDCRGPSGACPCRSKVDANGIRKHC